MKSLSLLIITLFSFSVFAQQDVAGVDGRCLAALNEKRLLGTYQLVDNYLVVHGSKAPPEIKVQENQTIMITRTGMAKVGPRRGCEFDKEISTYSIMANALNEVLEAPLSRFSSRERAELMTACQWVRHEKVTAAIFNLGRSLPKDTTNKSGKKTDE